MFSPPVALSSADPDASIRLTDSDAAIARLSASQRQYFQDPFIKHLVPRAHLQPPRPPLINVGTYIRSTAIDELVHRWFELSAHEGKLCQVVSLGAGSDTRFWRLATSPYNERLAAYIELDFPEITGKKAMAIRKSRDLSAPLGKPEDVVLSHGGTTLHAPIYHLVPVDLRLPPTQTLSSLLASPSPTPPQDTSTPNHPLLSPSLPTLLIFECVLVYMSSDVSSALIQWFVDYFSASHLDPKRGGGPLGGIVYEMFGLGDAFGKVMQDNLKSRNVSLPGAAAYPSELSLPNRFLKHSFTTAKALTLRDIRRAYLEPAELERTSKLEMLDEVEELELVLQHYAVTWGVKCFDNGEAYKANWNEWGLQQQTAASTSDDEEG